MKFIVLLLFVYSLRAETAFVKIPGGDYQPLYAKAAQKRTSTPCLMAVHQVTNAEYLDFVKKHPEWQRSKVNKQLVDANYLHHWAGDSELGVNAEKLAKQPVTFVSWYAARAYANSIGARLPTQDEWEYVARADATRLDATSDQVYLNKLLDWYGKPSTEPPSVEAAEANVHGVKGLHGIVWEWVHDFNTTLIVGDSRGDGSLERNLFCGGSSLLASDVSNYAAFMRYAMRSSLRGNFCLGSLGFRIVKSDGKDPDIISQKMVDAKTPYELDSAWTDQNGRVIKLSQLKDKVRVVTLGFTSCKYACPRIVSDMKRIEKELGSDAQKIGFLFISIDPEEDTPARFKDFFSEHKIDSSRWLGLNGAKNSVQDLSIVMNYQYQEVSGEFAHSNLIAVLDTNGNIVKRIETLNGNITPAVEVVRTLLQSNKK